MISKITRKVAGMLALFLATCATSGAWAAAPVPVAEWSGDLANGSVKNTKYTMSADSGDSSVVSFSDGNANLSSTSSTASKGVMIVWPDPASDAESFTSKKMSVVIQYSGLSIPAGNTSLLAALWGPNTKEYMIRTSSGNGTAGIATDVTNSSSGYQHGPSSNYPAPTKGRLLAIFSGDSSCRPGMDLYFSTYNDSTETYGDYQRVAYWSDKKVDNGTFYGIKVGGTIASTSSYYRPGMTVESVQLYDDVVSATAASMSSDMAWSDLVWDKDMLDLFPASLWTYIVNVTDNATLNLSGATIAAQSVVLNIPSGKTLTLEGTATITGASISVTGGGKLKLNTSNPGCAITVASGGTMDIAVATVSCAIINNGTINADGCAFNGAVSNSGTLNTSGTVSFSSNASNTSSGTFNVVSGTTTYNSNSQKGISGTLNIAKNATLINGKQDSIPWDGTVHVHIHGIVTMNAKWTIGANNYIHLYDGALVNGSVENAFHFNSGEGKIIAETGSSTITAPFVKGNGTIAKSGSGTLRLENQRLPSIKGSEGTIEVVSTEKHNDSKHSHTDSNIPFSGTVKFITSSSPSGQYHMLLWSSSATAGMFANRPALDVSGEVRLYDKIATYPLNVRNLCGTGTIRMGGGTTVSGYRYIDTSQTANTVFDGMFTTISGYAAYDSALTVRGADDATKTYSLTLTGANNTTGPLVITNNAQVIFSSTGSWAGGTVTVKNGGVLESQNSESIAARLVVQEGATLKFANGVPLAATEYDWSGVSNDQSVNVDLSGIAPSATPVTLIASDVTVTKDKFAVLGSQTPATLSVDGEALKVTFANVWRDGAWLGEFVANENATLYISQNSMLTVSEALSLGAVTVVKESEGNVTLTISGEGALTTGGWTIPEGVTVNTPTTMTISGTVSGGGIINVPANTTLTMDDVTTSGDTLADRVKVTVSGTLKTKGTTTLSAANTSAAGSLIEVVAGTTTLSSAWQGIAGDITVDANATLAMSESLYNGSDYYYNHIAPGGNSRINVTGTIALGSSYFWNLGEHVELLLHKNGEITGSRTDLGSIGWTGNGSVVVDGDATINAPIRINDNISPTLTVEDNVTLTISKAFLTSISKPSYGSVGGSITKAGAGTLDLTAISPTKPITINAGKVVADEVPTANVTINENGTFTLKDKPWAKGDADCFRGAGTLELYAATQEYGHDVEGVSFSGIVKVSNVTGKQNNFTGTAAMFASAPEFILDADKTHLGGGYYNNNDEHPFEVKNLSGSGNFKSQWDGSAHSYIIKTTQTKDTVFSGAFESNHSTGDRVMNLTVVGDGSGTVHSLTLTKAQNTSSTDTAEATSTLTVSDNAKVVFTSTGGWGYGNVLVGNGGWLQSTNATAVTKLTLRTGSHLVLPTKTSQLTGVSTISASGTIKVHIADDTVPDVGTYLVDWSAAGLASAPGRTYLLAGASATTLALEADTSGLKVVACQATLTRANGEQLGYARLSDAVNDFVQLAYGGELDAYITISADVEPTESQLSFWTATGIRYDSDNRKLYAAVVAQIGARQYPLLALAVEDAADNATVTLVSDSEEANVALNNKTINFVEGDGATFTGTFSGTGTLKLPAGALFKSPSDEMWASDWEGTVWISGVESIIGTGTPSAGQVLFEPNKYGREGSTLKLSGVKGWILAGVNHAVTINPDIELADGAYGYGLWLNAGYSYSADTRQYTDIRCLKGDGTLVGSDDAPATLLKIAKWDDFEGALTLNNKVVVFGADAELPEPSAINGGGYIIVGEGESVTVPNGKTWTLAKGAIVNGTLTNASGSLVGTGNGLKFDGSGVVTQCVAGAVNHGTEVHGSLSVVFSGAVAKFGSSSISMYDTATLTFDPGAGNTNTMSYGLAAATTGNKVIVKSGTLHPTITVDDAPVSPAFNYAEIVIENGGELLLDQKDTTGYNRCDAPICVKTGGVLNIAMRETMAHDLYLEGGVLRITGAQQDRGLDLFSGLCTIYATENSTIEATGDYPIYVRDADATINVADGKTLTCNCAFVYHAKGDHPTHANSTNDIIKTGTGTLVLNGQSSNSFALPKGLVVNEGTVEVNTTLLSNGQTGDAANYYTVASGAKLKVGATGQVNAATLTLNDGSLLEFGGVGNTSTAFIEVNTAEFASGTTTVSFSSGVTPMVGAKLISWTSKPAGAFSLEASLAASYALVSEATGLSIANGVAVVNGTAYATLQAAIDAAADSDTVTLIRDSSESVTQNVNQITFVENSGATFTGTFSGTGTLKLPAGALFKSPREAMWASDWEGTVWISGVESIIGSGDPSAGEVLFEPNKYGREGSTLKLSGVKGWILAGVNPEVIKPDIELADGAYGYGLWLNNGSSYWANNLLYTDIRCLKGDGTLVGSDGATTALLRIADWDDFAGALTLTNKVVVFDTDAELPGTSAISGGGYIIVGGGESVTVPNGKTWTLAKGAIVNGTLTNLGSLVGTGGAANFTVTVASGAKLKVGDSGHIAAAKLTLNNGSLLEFGGVGNTSTAFIEVGTAEFASGTTTVSFSSGVTPTVGAKLISWTGNPAGAFSLAAPLAASYALVSEATGLSIASGVAVVNGTTAYATLQAAIAASAGSGQTITLLRDIVYAPSGSVEIGNLDIGNHTLTLTTCAADQVISVTNLAGTGSVIVNSSENPGVGRVAFTGENTGFTGSITVADGGTLVAESAAFTGSITVAVGGTLVAESAAPWKASSETSEGMASVTVNGTLMLTHGAYMHGIVLKQVTWGASSRLELVDSVEADGSITVSNDYASGVPLTCAVVDIYRVALDGVTKTSDAGSKTDTYTYKPHISGSACLLDFTFTNTVRVVENANRIVASSTSQWQDYKMYSLKTDWDGKNTVTNFLDIGKTDKGQMWPTYTNYVDTIVPPQYTALHALIRPFRGTDDDDNGNVEAHAVYFLPNDRPCSAFVAGTIPSAAHTCFVSFGSTQGGIFLATGDTPDELDLIYLNSTENKVDGKVHFRTEHCTKLTTMRVPYGDAAQHTVVFETSDHQTYDIYLDGELWTRYTFPDRIKIQHGFHIGSWIGGDNEAEGFYRKIDVDTAPNSYISAIRIYDTALGANAIAALAEEFPYVSPGVGYERILTTSETTESWSQENAWRNVAESEVFTETVPADMSSLVTITNDSDVVKTIEVNLDRTQKIESLTVSGANPVHFVKDTGLVAIYGKVTIDTDVYNEYGALDMFGVPLEIADGKHLTLDLTNMPIDDYYEVTHIRISGYSTEPDNPEATTHEEKKGWPLIPLFPKTKRYDFDVEYNMTDHSYYLVIYPNHTHVDDVQGNPSGFISVHDPAEAVLTQLTGRDYVLPATVNKVSVEYGKYDITKVFDGGDVGGQFFITNIVDGKVHPTLNPEASIAIDGQTISVSPVVAAVRVDGNDVAAMADGDNESVMFGVKTIPGLWYAVATSENGNNFTVDYDSIRQATGTALKLESDELQKPQKIRLFRILASESKAELGTAKLVSDVLAYVNGTDYQGLNAHGMDIDEGAVAGFGPVVYGLKVAGSEDGDFFDNTFRSLTFNLNGTATDGKVYALKNADGFTVATATSASGSVTFSLGPNAIANGTLYLVAPETMLETVGVASYKWNGQEAKSVGQTAQIPLVMLANTPAKDGLKSVNTVLDANSDINTNDRNVGSVYRIPAIANNGTNIVAMFDCRYLNHNDLGTKWAGNSRAIDQAICESADSGLTWTSPTIAIDVPNYNNGDTGVALRECDFGDPCLGFFNHKFYVMAQTGVGLQGSDTNDNDLVMYSRDEEVGSAWGNRTSVQAAIMSALGTARGEDPAYPATRGILQGPGHAIVSNDKLHFPMQYFPLTGSGNPRVFVASLDSNGTWTATKLTAGTEDAEEPSLAVLDNGDWYMIAKDGEGGQTGGRHVFVSKDHNSWTKVAKQFVGETPPVQGSMLKVGTKNGHGVYVAAMDTGSKTGDGTNDGRRDIKLFIGTDASSSDADRTYNESSVPITWTSKAAAIMIYDGYTEGQGYNSIVQIDATTIGVLFEAAKHIYFKKVDISTYVDVN